MRLNNSKINELVKEALREDRAFCDITTKSLISSKAKIRALIVLQEDCLLSGLEIAKASFKQVDRNLKFVSKFSDGKHLRKNSIVAKITGNARAILSAERVALNFLSHASGIATLTAKFLNKVKGTKAKIMDTRKTIPLLRHLEKYAISCGGGINHRMSLADSILVKDNHKQVLLANHSLNLTSLIKRLKSKNKRIEIEVESVGEFSKVISLAPEVIMLDNMNLKQLRRCVSLRQEFSPKTKLEASGGITLKNVCAIAKTKVDFISIGALTHSSKAIDFSLEIA